MNVKAKTDQNPVSHGWIISSHKQASNQASTLIVQTRWATLKSWDRDSDSGRSLIKNMKHDILIPFYLKCNSF